MPHPSYSADLAPSDSHLFVALRETLEGKGFRADNARSSNHKLFFLKQPNEAAQMMAWCIEVQGEYVQKLALLLINVFERFCKETTVYI
jgi:hypothetical protein